MGAGQPAKYSSPEAMQAKIEEYFQYIQGDYNEVEDEETGETKRIYERYPEPVTITGLCIFLGFDSRQSFYDYQNRPEFSYTIKKARMLVEHSYEKNLYNGKVPAAGTIFALKNMGWTDKQEHGFTDKEGNDVVPTPIVFTTGSNES